MSGFRLSLRTSLRAWARATGALLALASFGCDDTSNLPGAPAATTQVAVALPSGVSQLEIGWVVQAADGSTVASGTENVGVQQDTLSLSLALPAGQGDTFSLQAVTSSGTICSGKSSPFNVVAGAPAAIDVAMSCQTTGFAPDGCPDVLVQGPTPPTAAVPSGTVSVVATASGPDVSSFAWVATGGAFGETHGGSTTYTCSTAGTQTIFLTVTYPDLPGCGATFLLPVTCLP